MLVPALHQPNYFPPLIIQYSIQFVYTHTDIHTYTHTLTHTHTLQTFTYRPLGNITTQKVNIPPTNLKYIVKKT